MSGDGTRPYPVDSRDISVRLRSSDWAGRTLDEKGADGVRVPRSRIPAVVRTDSSTTLAQGDSVSNIPGRGPYQGVRPQPFQGPVGNNVEKMVAFSPKVDSEPGEPLRGRQVQLHRPDAARQARARSVPRLSSPEPPGMGRGWLLPWNINGGGHSPSWPDVPPSSALPPAQTSPGEGRSRTQMNEQLPLASSSTTAEARPSRRDTLLSTSSPSEHRHGGDVQVPSRVGVAQQSVAGRDGRGDGVGPVLDGGSTVPSRSEPLKNRDPDRVAPPLYVAPVPTACAATQVDVQPATERGSGAGGTLKEKRRMSGFMRRLFGRKFASNVS